MSIFTLIQRRIAHRYRGVFYIILLTLVLFVVNPQLHLTSDLSLNNFDYLSSSEFNALNGLASAQSEIVLRNDPALGYTNYTIHRLGLKPIKNQSEALEPDFGVIVNDFLAFNYHINVAEKNNLCQRWQNQVTESSTESKRRVLLVVVSAAKNVEKRALIRRTWGKHPKLRTSDWLKVIFLIGSLRNESEEDQDTQILIQQESFHHGDLVQVNIVDSYKNLTLKSVAMLHWAYTNCASAQLLIKCDDDNYVNYEALARVVPYLNDENSIYGTRVSTLRPARSKRHKHYISRQAWPWPRYPFYLMGGSYAIAVQAIQRILAAAQTTPLFPFEDVYMIGLCAQKAKVRLRTKPAYYEPDFPGFSGLDACFVRETAIWQTLTTLEFARSHRITNRVYKQNLECKSRKKKVNKQQRAITSES